MADASSQHHADEQDASMDTILASIRRIIMEDEAGAQPATGTAHRANAHDDDDDLLVLQPSMIVDADGSKGATMAEPVSSFPSSGTQSAADLAAALFDAPEPAPPPAPKPAPVFEPVAMQPHRPVVAAPVAPVHDPRSAALEPPIPEPDSLLAPAASLAAAQALASLQNAVRPEPPQAGMRLLRSGGPTIEDMVRDELRVQLKDWLDANLPSLVERLVAQEIGRLVGRG